MCWSHYTTPPQVFRASLTRGKSSCIWYGVMRPHARPLNIIILLWSGGILVVGGLINLRGKNVRYSGKNSGVYNFSSEKENQQAIILVWFKVPVGVSSYNYVQSKIFRCMFLCFSVECTMGWSRCQLRLRKNEPNQSTVFIFLVMFGGFPRSSFRSISVASFR